MTKSESKYFNTALVMDEALIDLLGRKDLQYISVKEICEKAGVNRSTFYLHYETIADLLAETVEHIQSEFQKSFAIDAKEFLCSIDNASLEDLIFTGDRYLLPYLRYVKEHKHVYRAVLKNPGSMQSDSSLSALYKYILQPIFSRFEIPEEDQRYWLVYHINGVMAIVFEWLRNNCLESESEIARVIRDCVRPGQYYHRKGC